MTALFAAVGQQFVAGGWHGASMDTDGPPVSDPGQDGAGLAELLAPGGDRAVLQQRPATDAVLSALASSGHEAGLAGPASSWPAADRNRLVDKLLARDDPAGDAARQVLTTAVTARLADPSTWPGLGFRPLPPGADWPPAEHPAPRTTEFSQIGDAYDVVVVGAGAGGGVVAWVLAQAGVHVLLVERGRSLSRTALPLDHLRNARVSTGRARQLDPEPGRNPRVVGQDVVDTPDPRWNGNASAVGGGTRVYGAQAWRFSPADFRMGSTYGPVPSTGANVGSGRPDGQGGPDEGAWPDWPIGYDDLEPWYDRAEHALGVCGPDGQRAHDGPRSRPYPMPPFAPSLAEGVLARGARQLGIATAAVPLLINSRPFNGRPACVRCGTCVGFACQADAKNGTDATLIPAALATGRCDLVAEVVAEQLLTGPGGAPGSGGAGGGTVTGVRLRGPDGARREIRARHTVVAAGAVESARLLLLSGVGNDHDQVGRYLQGHAYAGAVGIFDEVVQDCVGPGASISTTDFRHGNPGVQGGAILANEFVPTPVEAWGKLAALGLVRSWGADGMADLRHTYPRTAFVVGPLQELPRPSSRVRLAAGVTDAAGLPVARFTGQGPHPQDRIGAARLAEVAAGWLRASGAGRVERTRPAAANALSGGQHQAGTCRMGTDPRRSVTDPWGAVWRTAGVTVADGSLHPTNGSANPALTIMAMAWRIADHLAAQLR